MDEETEKWSELSAEELIGKKDAIEAEIKAQNEILEGQKSIGMSGALVDAEGFPRGDVDIYVVRKARNRIICLRNDHKTVMKLIEEKLHQLHAEAKENKLLTQQKSEGSAHRAEEGRENKPPLKGFARVNVVTDGSPASLAGLRVGDLVIEFGSVSVDNFKNLQDIGTLVQHSQERAVRVVVARRGERMALSLTPRRWAGRGLLGCNIVPT